MTTGREKARSQVVSLRLRGYTNKQIAEEMNIEATFVRKLLVNNANYHPISDEDYHASVVRGGKARLGMRKYV